MKIRAGKKLPLWASVALNMLMALVAISLVQGFLVKAYRIPSGSMEPTLQGSADGGDRILVNRLAYLGSGPGTGDIVVFTRPESWQAESAVPRRGGIGGLARSFGDVDRDRAFQRAVPGEAGGGEPAARPSAAAGTTANCASTASRSTSPTFSRTFRLRRGVSTARCSPRSLRCVPSFTVPEGELVVLGDHRSNSVDSAIACRTPADVDGDCVRTIPASAVVGQVAGNSGR